jgi:hypothetical protein
MPGTIGALRAVHEGLIARQIARRRAEAGQLGAAETSERWASNARLACEACGPGAGRRY